MSDRRRKTIHDGREVQSFVSIPHSKFLYFSKLQQKFTIKYRFNQLSAIDSYHRNQNQKENCKILVINHKKQKLKGEKKLEKLGVLFVSKPNTSHFGHLNTMKMDETLRDGRSCQNPACWPKKCAKSQQPKALEQWP